MPSSLIHPWSDTGRCIDVWFPLIVGLPLKSFGLPKLISIKIYYRFDSFMRQLWYDDAVVRVTTWLRVTMIMYCIRVQVLPVGGIKEKTIAVSITYSTCIIIERTFLCAYLNLLYHLIIPIIIIIITCRLNAQVSTVLSCLRLISETSTTSLTLWGKE